MPGRRYLATIFAVEAAIYHWTAQSVVLQFNTAGRSPPVASHSSVTHPSDADFTLLMYL